MIKQLNYSVTFPSTGRTLSEAVLFQGGFGAIVGPNESGKTMIVEMVRFCLFGSAALRGKAEDYKNLKASLDFVIRNQDYTVDRTGTKAQLKENGEVVAVGITPVNVKIAQILGFGLTVFDMACVANQNQLLALGEMKPAERRRAVDSVIGVSVLDDLAKSAGVEALAQKRAGDDLASNNRLPIEPVLHDGYRESSELSEEKAQLDSIRSQADQLRGWLANEKKKPVAPVAPHGLGSAVVQTMLDAQNERKIQRQVLEGELARIPAASGITMDELAADRENHKLAQAHRARRQFLAFNKFPDLDQDQIKSIRRAWDAHHDWQKVQHLKKQKADLLSKGEHTCPSCTHQWPVAGDAIESVDRELEVYSKSVLLPERPSTTEAELDRHQRELNNWLSVKDEWNDVHSKAPETPPSVRWTLDQIASLEHGIQLQDRRAELVAEIEKLKPADKEPDYATMLRQAQQHEAQVAAWSTQMDEFRAWEAEKSQKMVQLAMLEVDLQGYDQLVAELNQALAYEQAYKVWFREFQIYNERLDKCTTYWLEADDWNKVKDALQILRSKIKQYLVPSLNRVASSLISHMTGGERQAINVDEEFNILVDGQTIDTLSGSGKAVANLALRIGLGQVLTNNIFSLFMGDEIDESMDKNRADKTAGVMHTLKGRISQLLLVSHKSPSADYFIAVGENSEYQLSNDQPD
jgi:DNA repair exonuclease SbcCD ATPase subunit